MGDLVAARAFRVEAADLVVVLCVTALAVAEAIPDPARQLAFIVGGLSVLSPDLRSEVERFAGTVQNPDALQVPVVDYGAVHRRRPWVLVVWPGNLRCAGVPER
ncbi:hypothetical protein [Streptomyces sp. NPDC054962]